VKIPVGLEVELPLPDELLPVLLMLLVVVVGNELLMVPIIETPGPDSSLIVLSGPEL
jgi:hypothetical protein